MGPLGYCSHFILHYASQTAPLTNHLRKGQSNRIIWDPELDTIFQQMRKARSLTIRLKNSDFTQPFLVHIDALDTGLSAILSHESEGVPSSSSTESSSPRNSYTL